MRRQLTARAPPGRGNQERKRERRPPRHPQSFDTGRNDVDECASKSGKPTTANPTTTQGKWVGIGMVLTSYPPPDSGRNGLSFLASLSREDGRISWERAWRLHAGGGRRGDPLGLISPVGAAMLTNQDFPRTAVSEIQRPTQGRDG